MKTATQKGAASKKQTATTETDDEVVVETRSPRNIQMEAMEKRFEEQRGKMIAEDLAEDPGAAAMQARIVADQRKSRAAAEADGLIAPLELEDGAASVDPLHEDETNTTVREDLPENLQQDPLADYIVMEKDKPMFVTKVNGKNMLIPLDEARRKLQIRTAAEIDMQNSREYSKKLDARAAAINAGEAALKARMGSIKTQAPPDPTVDNTPELDENEIAREAQAFVSEAFTGTEEEAAKRLAKLLVRTRTPRQTPSAPAQAIDVNGIVRQATTAAISAVDQRDSKKDLIKGIAAFEDQYPEIIGDVRLYNMADNMTDEIATEHPEWPKSRVMLEAGKRTREWVESLKGSQSTVDDEDTELTDETMTSEHTQSPNPNLRQERKSGLVRIPQAAAAAVQKPVKETPVQVQSPQEAIAEMRKARGQPF